MKPITTAPIDTKMLERKVWTSFFQDGIWDIYLGLMLLSMAVGAFLTDAGLTEQYALIGNVSIVALATIFLWFGKRIITLPRAGAVTFGPAGKARITKAAVIATMSCFVGLAAFILASLTMGNMLARLLFTRYIMPVIWASSMLVMFSLAAFFLSYGRLYIIGLLYAIAVPADIILRQLLHADVSYIAFGVPALVILLIGFIVLARFLKNHPIPHNEEQNVQT